MARYNSEISSSQVSTTAVFNSPQDSLFTTLTGTAGYTVTLPNPVLFPGETQTFYNSTAGDIILATPTGQIVGPGLVAASSVSIPASAVFTLTSNGTNYVSKSGSGGPISGTTITASTNVTSNTVQGSTAASGTLTLKSTSDATKATAGILMTDGVTSSNTTTGTLVVTGGVGVSGRINAANFDGIIGANSAAAGSFTTLGASSTVTLSPANFNVAISPTGTGTVTISPVGTLTTGTVGTTHSMLGNISATTSNQTVSLAPTGNGTVTIGGNSSGAVTISPSGLGSLAIAPTTAGSINNMNIGATTRGTGAFTTLNVNSTATFSSTVTVPTPVNNTDATTKAYVDAKGAYASVAFSDATTTYNANGNVTGFVSNGITYSLITYELVTGQGATYGAQYYRPLTWREVDSGGTRNMTVTYAATGRVASLAVA